MADNKSKIKKFLSELTALKFTPWYRWHPQLALRYLPVVEEIRKYRLTKARGLTFRRADPISIIEIGSGGLGIAPYLKMPVTGVDVRFEDPIHSLLKPVIGDAINLDFSDNSFDVVVSMDMLEHLSNKKRAKAISEMLRVARKMVVVGAPCGDNARKQDKKLKEKYVKSRKKSFGFFEEHQKYDLPVKEDIIQYIKQAAEVKRRNLEIIIKGNMNIKMREFLMKGWISERLLMNILFRKIFLLFIPIFRILDRPPYYRQLFFIKL